MNFKKVYKTDCKNFYIQGSRLLRKDVMIMKTEKTNRKVKYTKMVLKESFIKLLKEKPISRITITEICEDADINRATFYAHYSDQYDLMQQIEQELIEDINRYLSDYSIKDSNPESVQKMERIFDYIQENCELCSVLLGEKGDKTFLSEVLALVQRQIVTQWTTNPSLDKEIADYLFSYATNGSVGIILKWLENGMNQSTHEMAETIIKMTNQGLYAFIGGKFYNKLG